MKIAVSMITLNEADYIQRAVHSTRFADYLCVVDGGSNDDTPRLIEEAVPEGVELIMGYRKWDDHFGFQRQAAYDLIPEDTDWWMRLDADEQYSGMLVETARDVLGSLPDEVVAAKIRQTNLFPDEDHYVANLGGFETHARIWRHIRTDTAYHQWTGQVHEFVQLMSLAGLNQIPLNNTVVWSAQVFHFGWLSLARRQEREVLYSTMPGSGVTKTGDLTDRHFEVRKLPVRLA